jgi:hypothetical protein
MKEEVLEVIGEVAEIDMVRSDGVEVTIVEEAVVVEMVSVPAHAEVSAEIMNEPGTRRHFHAERHATLLEVFELSAKELQAELLPPRPATPLDRFRGIYDGSIGEPLDLSITLGEFLEERPSTHHFAVELVLAIRVNTRWRVAPTAEMTPVAILTLFGLSSDEYSLYRPHEHEPLPPNAPVRLHRGEGFEAQKDGRYGGG